MADTVNVIGLGYVGTVIATGLTKNGHSVIGVDLPSVIEETCESGCRFSDLEKDFRDARDAGQIKLSSDYTDATGNTTIIAVDTPTDEEGSLDTSSLEAAARELGSVLSAGEKVILKSTVLPGTCEDRFIPALEKHSGLERGEDFYFCYSPEFLRGGEGKKDFHEPAKTVLSGDEEAVRVAREVFPESGAVIETDIRTAEAVKYFDNAFHALKISFAKEVARICDGERLDPNEIMDILKKDKKLNISEKYLDPGSPFGGP